MARETFQIGDLTAVIGDNEGYEGHRAGYNGVHRLTHRTHPKSLFTVAGLNLEHIFDGDQDLRGDRTVTFEPRNAPMTLRRSPRARPSCTNGRHRHFTWRVGLDSSLSRRITST